MLGDERGYSNGLGIIGRGDVKRGEIYKDTHVDPELFTSTTGIGRSR
jgi:hypothetical protein